MISKTNVAQGSLVGQCIGGRIFHHVRRHNEGSIDANMKESDRQGVLF